MREVEFFDWLKSQDKVNRILISVSIVLVLFVGIFGVFAISQGGQQQPEEQQSKELTFSELKSATSFSFRESPVPTIYTPLALVEKSVSSEYIVSYQIRNETDKEITFEADKVTVTIDEQSESVSYLIKYTTEGGEILSEGKSLDRIVLAPYETENLGFGGISIMLVDGKSYEVKLTFEGIWGIGRKEGKFTFWIQSTLIADGPGLGI